MQFSFIIPFYETTKALKKTFAAVKKTFPFLMLRDNRFTKSDSETKNVSTEPPRYFKPPVLVSPIPSPCSSSSVTCWEISITNDPQSICNELRGSALNIS